VEKQVASDVSGDGAGSTLDTKNGIRAVILFMEKSLLDTMEDDTVTAL
jgi:hypothetical protein